MVRPLVTDSSPAIMRRSVDFRHPLGPTRTSKLPIRNFEVHTLMTSNRAAKSLRTFSIEMLAILSLDSAGEGPNDEAAGKSKCNHRWQHIEHSERAKIAVIDCVRSLESSKQSDRQQL